MVEFRFEIKKGIDGPYRSASKIPTFLFKIFDNVNARLMATVVFPTPPLQLLTAIIFFTNIGLDLGV